MFSLMNKQHAAMEEQKNQTLFNDPKQSKVSTYFSGPGMSKISNVPASPNLSRPPTFKTFSQNADPLFSTMKKTKAD
jgi:hypothetical protein